jgi:hypothetical protein
MTIKQVTLYTGTREEFEETYSTLQPVGESFSKQLDTALDFGFIFYYKDKMTKDKEGNLIKVTNEVYSDLIRIV